MQKLIEKILEAYLKKNKLPANKAQLKKLIAFAFEYEKNH